MKNGESTAGGSDLLGLLMARARNTELVLDSLDEVVIAHDRRRRIVFFNRAAERLTGLRREDVLGRDCHDVLEGGICGSRCPFCAGCEPGPEGMRFRMEMKGVGGSVHELDMVLLPMVDESGRVVGAVVRAADLTELNVLRKALGREHGFHGLVGRHPSMRRIYELIAQVAGTTTSVLVLGESGTGKELVARAIHEESDRAGGPFVPIHCGAIPESLLESELFGHVAGAFTGAERNKKGRLELAHGGTVFLDEVGETSPNVQVKLLRVLEDKMVEPLGAEGGRKADVRIVAATNRNLKQLVKEGKFREDLYYRLAVVTIELPPLRERKSDIPLLAEYLLERECAELGCSSAGISPDAMAALMDHDWPGNVRELQNALRHALVLSGRGRLEARHLPEAIVSTGLGRRGRPRKLTREHVRQALEKAKNNRKRAAEILGVSRSTLYRYLEQ